MNDPVAVNDSGFRFSLKKLFVIPVVFAVALLLWRVSPLHGIVGLISASVLSASILLSQRADHRPLAVKFVLTLLFAILVGFVAEAILLPKGPPKALPMFLFFGAIVAGGVFGWSIAHLTTRRDRNSDSRLVKVVAAATAISFLLVLLITLFWCRDNEEILPPRFETGLTLVALSDEGDLIDAISIPSDDSVTSVVFRLPENLENMQLVLWGDHIHDSIPKGVYFTTSRKGLGEIRVGVVDGIAESVVGNGYGTPFTMPSRLVEHVQKHLDAGRIPIESTEIRRQ